MSYDQNKHGLLKSDRTYRASHQIVQNRSNVKSSQVAVSFGGEEKETLGWNTKCFILLRVER